MTKIQRLVAGLLSVGACILSTYISASVRHMHDKWFAEGVSALPVDSIPICERMFCPPLTGGRRVLFGIKSPATPEGAKRRQIIRDTFVRQILEYSPAIANYTFYTADMASENGEEKDLTVLKELHGETRDIATHIKTLAFFRALLRQSQEDGQNNKLYEWVCHIDDDSYLQIYRLMRNYLLAPEYHPFRTVIGRMRVEPATNGDASFLYPGGQMYCVSWDIMRNFARYFEQVMPECRNHSEMGGWPADDLLVGLFLHRTGGGYRFVDWPNALAYDLGPDWNLHAYAHAANPKLGINPHKMKSNKQYQQVADAYENIFLARDF